MLSIRRRDLIAGGLTFFPTWSRGQPANLPLIGALLVGAAPDRSYVWTHLVESLRKRGYVQERTVNYAARAAESQVRLSELAAELAELSPRVIHANGDEAARAAASASTSIPIVAMADDHIGAGLTDSFARPSRNITGISQVSSELVPKRLGLLHDLVPAVTTIALLVNANDPRSKTQIKDMQDAAHAVGLQIRVLNVSAQGEISSAFAKLPDLHADALIVGTGELFNSRPDQLAELAARQRIPAIYQAREFVAAGGLASYGSSRIDAYRQVGVYAGRVLKGERPADLPVARPTKFELVINLKTAKALGLTIPSGVIAIADEVIE